MTGGVETLRGAWPYRFLAYLTGYCQWCMTLTCVFTAWKKIFWKVLFWVVCVILFYYPPGKEFFRRIFFQLRLWFCFIFILFLFFCYHDNSWKGQSIRTKFSHMISDWKSSAKFENGHHRSHVTLRNSDFCPPWKFTYLRFQPTETKFSHMTFDWNSSSEVENGHHRSHVIPLNRGHLPPQGKLKYLRFWWNLNHKY